MNTFIHTSRVVFYIWVTFLLYFECNFFSFLFLMFVLNVTIFILLFFFAWNYISFRGNTLSMEKVLNCSMVFGFVLFFWYYILLYSLLSVCPFSELNKWRQNDGISCSNKQYILINITKTITLFLLVWWQKRIMKS